MPARKLILVDGTSLVYRSFFAIRELSTRDGRPTNAVFGFIRALRQVLRAEHATHCLVAFEGGRCVSRAALLPAYKANRPPMPEALAAQLPAVSDYLARAAIREQRIEAFEADDVIASAAAWARPEADEIVVASDDKDLCQLVDERVSLLSLSKKERMGPAEVAGRMGVGPGRVVELLALTGDAVDNIPGVPGVGPKTAVRLLAEHPSLDDLFARLDGVEPERVRTALREHRADVLRNAELTRLRSDLDCGVTWDALAIRPEDPARLLPFYESLEFRAMADALRSPELDLGPA